MLISNRDRSYLRIAAAAALESTCRWRVGAVIIRGGSILSISSNKIRHHPRDMQIYTLHAEAAALQSIKNADGATIYVVRVGRIGDPRMARPCPACAELLLDARVSKSVYSLQDGTFIATRIRDLFIEAA